MIKICVTVQEEIKYLPLATSNSQKVALGLKFGAEIVQPHDRSLGKFHQSLFDKWPI